MLCFIHQDARLLFDAAAVVPRYFARLPRTGVLGFCGSAAQRLGKQWHQCPPCFGSLLQGRDATTPIEFAPPGDEVEGLRYAPVQTLDGYCLFVRREVFTRIDGFDETYPGWHGYDLDLCLRALDAGYQNYVIAQPSQHYSWGARDHDLARALDLFARKWSTRLAAADARPATATASDVSVPVPRQPLRIHVYAIARDEEKFAARFAQSCAGADGVHVLDTGSSDRTVAILREHGVHVESAIIDPWRFDLARNRSLELVPDAADVCLSIDLDETLVADWRRIVEDAWVPGTNHLDYQYAWQMINGKPYRAFHYNKCHSRRGYVWVTPVHEVVAPIAGFREVFASTPRILVEHRPDPNKSRAQYLALLELAVREDAGDARSRFYLGREYTYVARWRDAIATLTEYLNRHPGAWSFERCSACLMIASCHDRLRQEAERDCALDAARQHEADALRWLLRACHEEPNQREPWVELADACRLKDDHAGTYWAAKKALALTHSSMTHLNEPEDWSWKPHDLLSVAAWYLGFHAESLTHALLAVENNPHDQRLIDNYLLVQARSAAPPVAGPPLVDVVILAYSKTEREYAMTRRCIASLRASSPEVPVRIVVVETNARLRSEEFTRDDAELFATGVEVVCPGTRFGYNEFVQAGYRAHAGSAARCFMVLNNDVVLFATGFLREMLGGLAHVPSVSPLGLREAQWGLVDRTLAIDINYDVDRAMCGWCLMFDKSILAAVPFEALFPRQWAWYGQDQAYAAALQAHGLAHGLVTAARALHLQASSHHLLDVASGEPVDETRVA